MGRIRISQGGEKVSRGLKDQYQQLGFSASRCADRYLITCSKDMQGFPGFPGKESTCQCWRHGFDPWAGKIPWRRKWQPTPVFLSGKSHGQRSLAGYSPWVTESDTTEQLNKDIQNSLREDH